MTFAKPKVVTNSEYPLESGTIPISTTAGQSSVHQATMTLAATPAQPTSTIGLSWWVCGGWITSSLPPTARVAIRLAAASRQSILAFTLGGASCLAPFPAAMADADAEREILALISHELAALGPLLNQAESQADPDARIRFRYDWRRQDLARIRLGIEEHINAPRAEPRTFPPLRGDYRR